MITHLDEATSETIRITLDSDELERRGGPIARRMATDFDCLAGCIREGLELYGD
jgi:hypothetical protein